MRNGPGPENGGDGESKVRRAGIGVADGGGVISAAALIVVAELGSGRE